MTTTERAYRLLTEPDDEGRACAAIPDEACAQAPRNFALNLGNGAATKLAEQVASPGVVLPLMLATVGAPVGLVGALEPVRRGLALVPQLAVSGRLRAYAVRKWFWVGAGIVQGATLVAMAAVAAAGSGVLAGVLVVAVLAVFSIASGIGSLAFQDVVGKTVPKPVRGRLLGMRATAGGVATLVVGVALQATLGADTSRGVFVALLLAAAVLWVAGSVLFAFTREVPGATDGGRDALAESRQGLRLLRTSSPLRRYVLARALLTVVEVALPFYALYAAGAGAGAAAIGGLLVAVGVANLVSNPVWGRLTDRGSSRFVLAAAGVVSALATAVALVLGAVAGVPPEAFAAVFLLASGAEAGVRLARRSWVINAAPPDERPLWISASNAVAGVVTLALAALGVLGQVLGVAAVLWVVLAMALAGSVAAVAMPADRTR
ncbi:MAG: hypothetical protein ACT4RN_01270 [Pseudonocardia sp.]